MVAWEVPGGGQGEGGEGGEGEGGVRGTEEK